MRRGNKKRKMEKKKTAGNIKLKYIGPKTERKKR